MSTYYAVEADGIVGAERYATRAQAANKLNTLFLSGVRTVRVVEAPAATADTHSVGRRDVQSSVSLLAGLSADWCERYYRDGRITQDEYEGYDHAWTFFHPSAARYAHHSLEAVNVTVLAIAVGLVDAFTPTL